MKKKNVKSLKLNKKSISKLSKFRLNGGINDPRTARPNCINDTTIEYCPLPCIYTFGPCTSLNC